MPAHVPVGDEKSGGNARQGHQPDCLVRSDARRARPDRNLVLAKMLEEQRADGVDAAVIISGRRTILLLRNRYCGLIWLRGSFGC